MKNALFWPLEPNFSHKLCPISVRNCKLRIIAWRWIRNFSMLNASHLSHSLPFSIHSVRSAPIPPFSIPSYLKQAENLSKIDIFLLPRFPTSLFQNFYPPFQAIFAQQKRPKALSMPWVLVLLFPVYALFPGHYAGFVREVNREFKAKCFIHFLRLMRIKPYGHFLPAHFLIECCRFLLRKLLFWPTHNHLHTVRRPFQAT